MAAGYAERLSVDPDDDASDGAPRTVQASPHRASAPGDDLLRTTTGPALSAAAAPAAKSRRSESGQATPKAADQGLMTPPAEPPSRQPSPPTRPARSPSTPARPAEKPSGAVRLTASNGHHEPGDLEGGPRLQHPYAGGGGPDQGGNGHHPAATLPEASLALPNGKERDGRRQDQGPGEPHRDENGAAEARPRLAPEHRDLVDRILAACRAAEGRNALGGYGSSGLTPALRRIAAQLPAGGLAAASEADTLKAADRFATRLARLIDRQPGRPPAELAATISDGIRYAFTFPAADYTEGTLLVHRKLKAQGFDLEARRNQWDSREYKGIFTRWRDPAHGLAFEVQFHTVEGWDLLKQTHDAYLRITDPATPAAERARLRARQATAAATLSPPPGCLDIADFKAGSR